MSVAAQTGPRDGSAGVLMPPPARPVRLRLLGGFRLLVGGEPVLVPMNGQKVVAFLALQDRPVLRSHVAASLWLEATEAHAGANLRSALWKVSRVGVPLVEVAGGNLQLAPTVTIDLRDSIALARLTISSPGSWEPAERDVDLFSEDLLPSWYEDWVLIEHERYRQLRLHALESLCERLTTLGRFASAIQAGFAAVTGEPLRESAHRALIAAFLAEGNVGEAMRQYEGFADLLRDELDLEPSPAIRALVGHVQHRSLGGEVHPPRGQPMTFR